MTTYLQMNGTSDHLDIPSIQFTQIVMDVNVISNYSGIQERIWSLPLGAGYLMRTPNQVDEYSSNVSSVLVNGAQVTNDTKFIPINSRNTITSNVSTTNKVYIFSNNGSNDFVQGNLYDIKFYNGSTLVAHFDMSTGTVNDQTGNGHNATLTGGTWVTSGTSGTVESVSFDTKLRIHAQETVSFDSKQKIYTTESVSFGTKQSIYIQETLSFDTKQIVYIHESTKFDAKQVVYMLETTSFDMTQRIYATETVNFDTKQRVYTVESISFDTKQKIDSASSFEIVIFDTKQALYASESVKIPTRQQIRDRFYYVTTIGR